MNNDNSKSGEERRHHKRVSKNFVLSYFDKTQPDQKYEVTQLKNISLGGICFITTRKFEPTTELGIELKTPYLTDTTYIEGVVLESREKVKNVIYETRLQFDFLSPEAEFLVAKLIELFEKEGR